MPEAQVFRWDHRVSYAECTVGNHVYHSRYLDMLEVARGVFLRSLGMSFLGWQDNDTIFPIVSCNLRYKAPARYDDLIAVELWLNQAEGIRLEFVYRVRNQEGALLVEATTMHVCTSLRDKPKRLPKELVTALLPFVHPGEDRSAGAAAVAAQGS